MLKRAGPRQRQSQQGGRTAGRQPSDALRPHAPVRPQVEPLADLRIASRKRPSCDCPISCRTLPPSSCFAVALGARACRNDPASYVASAKAYLAKSDYKAAIIELKNALQKAPDNGEARYLLAKSLLATGDPCRRGDRGAQGDRCSSTRPTRPIRCSRRRWLRQGEFKKLVAELGDRKLDAPRRAPELERRAGDRVSRAWASRQRAQGACRCGARRPAGECARAAARRRRWRSATADQDLPRRASSIDEVLAERTRRRRGDAAEGRARSSPQGKRDDAHRSRSSSAIEASRLRRRRARGDLAAALQGGQDRRRQGAARGD